MKNKDKNNRKKPFVPPGRPAYNKLGDIYPTWLTPADLDGRPHTLTIRIVRFDKFPARPGAYEMEPRAILGFKQTDKEFILNPTQARAVARVADSEMFKNWPGTRIRVSPGTAANGKETIVVSQPTAPSPNQSPAAEADAAG